MQAETSQNLTELIALTKARVNSNLDGIFSLSKPEKRLVEAMRYATMDGGKRIRPLLVYASAKAVGARIEDADAAACAVELIHSFSLVHDDLPVMDDDDLRRGKPATHIKFGESTAVLAGNSLLTLAFEILSSPKLKLNEKIKINLIKKLSECSGHLGIAGGQYLDLSYERKKISRNKILEMEIKKTGMLFSFCCAAPAIIKKKTIQEIKFFENIGSKIGLLFQIADDLIDLKSNSKEAGKKTGKDQKKGKATLINLIGYDDSLKYCDKIIKDINKNLKKYGSKSEKINETLGYIMNRKK